VLEGSIDCESWVEINHHTNDSSLNSEGAIATFPISFSSDYQYIRLRQIDVNSTNYHSLEVSAIEFYGTLTIPKHEKIPIKNLLQQSTPSQFSL
jgi:hypothetical protein